MLVERWWPYKLPPSLRFLQHLYLLLVVAVGWVFFRSDTLLYAQQMLVNMFTFSGGVDNSPLLYFNTHMLVILCVAVVFTTPIRTTIANIYLENKEMYYLYSVTKYGFYLLLFAFSSFELAQATYNPFIYFRF